MLPRLRFLLSYLIFWLLFFEAARLLFISYHHSLSSAVPLRELVLSFVYGLRMDLSVASYILVPVCLFMIASFFLPFFRKPSVYLIYSYLILLFFLLLTIADLEVFKSWEFRMDATPLKYLSSPREAWASVSHLPVFLILIIFILVYIGICLLLRRVIHKTIYLLQETHGRFAGSIVLVVVTGLLLIPIRGGLQLTPMNQSMVYFSKNNFANVAAVNASWNFLNSLAMGASTKNPYNYMSSGEAEKIVQQLYQGAVSTDTLLSVKRPNVLLVIWESFTEKALHQQLEGKEIVPRFNELRKEGLYFSNLYASGDRTDKGLAAVLSGYPAMNNVSIIRFPQKSSKLMTLSQVFKAEGYVSSFFYGGETAFANIKSYLLQSGYDSLIDKGSFRSSDLNSKWGAHDGVVADRILSSLKTSRQPFFTTWLTLSSHEPFETPAPSVFAEKNDAALFANSLHYTDESIYQFVRKAEQQPWWDSTLMIVIADHGHPMLEPSNRIDNFHIPMLWLGGALKKKGVVETVGSQVDLAATLTAAIGKSGGAFPFSKNIFSSAKPWAYYSFNNGFGMVRDSDALVFDNVGRQVILQRGKPDSLLLRGGKAMQQYSFEDYIRR